MQNSAVVQFLFFGFMLSVAPLTLALEPDPPQGVHFQFREPHRTGYYVSSSGTNGQHLQIASQDTVQAFLDNGSTNAVEFGRRVAIQIRPGTELSGISTNGSLRLARRVDAQTFILEAPDVWSALREAESLAQDPRVTAAYPVARRPKQLNSEYAPRPNDPFFADMQRSPEQRQANLENRDTNGLPAGLDLNVRAAWPVSRGEGVIVALGDNGVELNHPDLVDRTTGVAHFNFVTGDSNGLPSGVFSYHATSVAGLVAASSDNGIGVAGVAPRARIASWVIFDPNDNAISDEALMDVFQYQSNVVAVQNHSWGKVGLELSRLSSLEDLAISNAVIYGRSGRGVVIVRAGGNGRQQGNDANEDGYLADPRIIGVAAVRADGRAARYSCPGACLLVGAPSGDVAAEKDPCFTDSNNLVTTDRQGTAGYNRNTSGPGNGDYAFGATGFSGTSGATPQISGVVALILGANPNLTYRDVQQILIHSGRHYDLTDPTLVTNGAGFLVSHNLGFGVPDAGLAVKLARDWPSRPPATLRTYSVTQTIPIPDAGFRLVIQGNGVPANLQSIVALPASGPHPETNTLAIPLVDVGAATSAITTDLRGKAALIKRGPNYFCEKINLAAHAGAELAIIYNNIGGGVRMAMAETDLSPIPAISISQNDGEDLRAFLAEHPEVQVSLSIESARSTFHVSDTFLCEFVGLRLDTDHTARGDLRVVLTSPAGTRSILQKANQDASAGPSDWTYYSVQHFYESSYGTWTLTVTDEDDQGTGSVKSASLLIHGIPIQDSDHDGLDDTWELAHFKSLAARPADDPDGDGYNNAREQIMATNPSVPATPFQLDLSIWDKQLARLSWPGNPNTTYRVQVGTDSVIPLTLATNLPGRFPVTEWFVPYQVIDHQFFRLIAVPKAN